MLSLEQLKRTVFGVRQEALSRRPVPMRNIENCETSDEIRMNSSQAVCIAPEAIAFFAQAEGTEELITDVAQAYLNTADRPRGARITASEKTVGTTSYPSVKIKFFDL